MILFIGLLILIVFLFIKFFKNNYRINYNNITYFQGEVGSGKTTILTHLGLKELRRRQRHNFLFCWLGNIFPNVKLFRKYNVDVYSTYPVWIDKHYGFSKVCDRTVLSWEYRLPTDSPIVLLDEMELVFPNERQQTDPVYKFGTAFIRHATNACIFASSQSLSETNIEFRRRVNTVYMLNNCGKGLLWSTVNVHKALASEEFTNIFTDNPDDESFHIYRFKMKDGHFDSRYASELYKLDQSKVRELSLDFTKLLAAQGLKCGDRWTSLKWKFI